MNHVCIAGNLGSDPELRYTPSGTALTTLSVAIPNRRRNEAGEWEDAAPYWVTVKCWKRLAENVAESFSKGATVLIAGRLTHETWEADDGSKRSKVVIVADDVGPSVRWDTATQHKAERG